MTNSNLISKWQASAPYLLSVLRITAGCMFMLAGTMKIFAFPAGIPANGGTVELMSQAGIGGLLEVFCGALLLFGLFTRPIAFLMAGQMAIAYWQFHAPKGVWPNINGGVTAALYCFIWLYISAAGGGPWSIDALRRKNKI